MSNNNAIGWPYARWKLTVLRPRHRHLPPSAKRYFLYHNQHLHNSGCNQNKGTRMAEMRMRSPRRLCSHASPRFDQNCL